MDDALTKPQQKRLVPRDSGTDANQNGASKLSGKVYDYVISQIKSGDFVPGHKVVPSNIAQRLNTSLMPVRDALVELTHKGWLERIPNKGTFVRGITADDVAGAYETRRILEVAAVRWIAEHHNKEQLAVLNMIVERLQKAADANDIDAHADADAQFHLELVRATGNRFLLTTYEAVIMRTHNHFQFSREGLSNTKTRVGFNLEDASVNHRRIYEAVVTRDVELAEKLITSHIAIACECHKAMVNILHLANVHSGTTGTKASSLMAGSV